MSFNADYRYRILSILINAKEKNEEEWFGSIRKKGRFNNSKLKLELDRMVKDVVIIREDKRDLIYTERGRRSVPKTYYLPTDKGESWFSFEKHRLLNAKKAREISAKQFELKTFQDNMERIIKAEGPRTRASWQKIPFYLPKNKPKYKGSITIEWQLMSKDEQRRLRELSKLTPEEKARRKEEFWQAIIANHYKRESVQKPKVEIPKNFFESR